MYWLSLFLNFRNWQRAAGNGYESFRRKLRSSPECGKIEGIVWFSTVPQMVDEMRAQSQSAEMSAEITAVKS